MEKREIVMEDSKRPKSNRPLSEADRRYLEACKTPGCNATYHVWEFADGEKVQIGHFCFKQGK